MDKPIGKKHNFVHSFFGDAFDDFIPNKITRHLASVF